MLLMRVFMNLTGRKYNFYLELVSVKLLKDKNKTPQSYYENMYSSAIWWSLYLYTGHRSPNRKL